MMAAIRYMHTNKKYKKVTLPLFFSSIFDIKILQTLTSKCFSNTHRWCCILRPVSLALWWSPCQLTLMVSFSHIIAVCVNRTVVTILPCSVSVYATTAANPHESSYACYYDEARDTYLGDWYSVNWMEDSDVVRIHTHHTRLILDMLNNFFFFMMLCLI